MSNAKYDTNRIQCSTRAPTYSSMFKKITTSIYSYAFSANSTIYTKNSTTTSGTIDNTTNAKMSSQLIESHMEKAVVYTGVGICKEKARELFNKFTLPNAILYLDDVVEFGYNESTGFMWLKRPKKIEKVHERLGSKGSFDVEVTLIIGDHSIKSLKGFKVKEMLMWIPVSGVKVDGPDNKLTFTTVGGITRSFDFSMFVLDD